jgi:TolA-binding protein
MPVGNTKLQMDPDKSGSALSKEGGINNDPVNLRSNLKKHASQTVSKSEGPSGPTSKHKSDQNLKLDVKPEGKLKEQLQARRSNLDEKLSSIINNLEKEKSLDEEVKTKFPFTQLLSEADRIKFAGLDATDKQKVAEEIQKNPTVDSKVIVKLWENALATNKVEQPLWLTLAPKAYKEAYDKASDIVKENINAKAEFFNLTTQYQIDNFWETSSIIARPVYTLNESISAVNPEEGEQKLDSFVAGVGEAMKRWQ